VKDVEEASQAARLGIAAGWRARSVAGEAMKSTDAFVSKVQELKSKAVASIQMAFSPPPLVASFEERPFGFSVDFDEILSLYMVTQTSGAAARAGVKPRMAITRVAGTDACSLGKARLIRILQQAALPASIIFETVPEESGTSRKRSVSASGEASAKLAKVGDIKVIGFDLSLPLGISLDDDCCAKRVSSDAQAAKAGVNEGWTVNAIEDAAVKTTRELVLRIRKIKKKGVTNARISFRCPRVPPSELEIAPTEATSSQQPSGSEREAKSSAFRRFEIRLQQPLGVRFDPKLNVKGIQDGSQAHILKICEGWQVCSLNDEEFNSTKELVTRMQSLKGQGVETVSLCFRTFADSAPEGQIEEVSKDANKSGDHIGNGTIHKEVALDTNANDTPKGTVAIPVGPLSVEPSTATCSRPSVAQRSMSFDLSQSLGINFDAKLVAKSVQEGSQAMRLGVGTGWKILNVGGETVQTTKELVARIKSLKDKGVQRVDVDFLDPSGDPSGANSGTEIQKELNPPVQITEDPPHIATQHKSVAFNLSQPLGINFDASVVVKSVQDGSQAAQAGVCIGWHALSVGEEPVQATKELVAKLKALKTQGVEQVLVKFDVHAPSAKRQHSAIAEDCEVAASKQPKSG